MRYTSLRAAQQLGISAVTIDMRILFKNYSHHLHPGSKPPKDTFNNLPFKLQNSNQPGISMNSNGEFLIKNYAPCILLIENMDSFVYGDDDKEVTNVTDEIQNKIVIIIEYFLIDLWNALGIAIKLDDKKKR